MGLGARADLRVAIGAVSFTRLGPRPWRGQLATDSPESPAKRPGPLTNPRGHVLPDCRAEVVGRGEAAVAQTLALKNAEEQFHLVDPGRVQLTRCTLGDRRVSVEAPW